MKTIKSAYRFLLFLLFFFLFSSSALAQTTLLINELVPYPQTGESEWLELFNPSLSERINLSGMRLFVYQGTSPGYTYSYSVDLSGIVPRQGFLTINFAAGDDKLPDDGACVVLFDSSNNAIFALAYGSGSCEESNSIDATSVGVAQGYSINAKTTWNMQLDPPQANWTLDSGPSKGWCDESDPNCFQVADLLSQLASEGVTSNIADQQDLSRTQNLYFDRTNYGRIAFASEINLTDRDAMTWLRFLGQKLEISHGRISLDAEMIKNLVDTQATLTMRNIDMQNPTIRVTNTDGTPGDSSIVSGLTYDKNAKTLTFTAAHFTTFEAVDAGSSSGSSSSSSPGPAPCADWPPSNSPYLFKITTTPTTATLYFTPVNDYLSYYYIAYGYDENDERFGISFPAQLSSGVQSYTVNHLAPNTLYYFKVRGGHGCAPGPWSNWLAAKTESSKTSLVSQYSLYPVPPLEVPESEEKPATSSLTPVREPVFQSDETLSSPTPTPFPIPSPQPSPRPSFWQRLLRFFLRLLGKN